MLEHAHECDPVEMFACMVRIAAADFADAAEEYAHKPVHQDDYASLRLMVVGLVAVGPDDADVRGILTRASRHWLDEHHYPMLDWLIDAAFNDTKPHTRN